MNLSYINENNKENDELSNSIFHYNLLEETNKSLSNISDHNFEFICFNDLKEEYIEKEIINKEKINLTLNKNRGRKIRYKSTKVHKIHDKFKSDNIQRKIQNHYMNFIVSFINEVLINLGYQERLYFLSYKIKLNITKYYFLNLQGKNIEDILCNEISPKYNSKSKFINLSIIQKIKNNPVIKSILSDSYLGLFKRIYYKSIRKINLNYYGFNKEIILSKNVKLYQDLLNKSNDTFIDENYRKRMNECVARKFLLNSIFICN